MNHLTLIIYLCAAAAIGAAISGFIVWTVKNSRIKVLEGKLANDQQRLDDREKNYKDTISELKHAHEEDLKRQLESVKATMTAETEKILKEREESLNKGNRSSIDEILNPLKESIEKMQKAMADNARDHLKSNTELKEQFAHAVKDIEEKTVNIGARAEELTTALTSKPKIQGGWGEHMLEDILSREGLVKGKQYDREVANDDRSRPDFVFHFRDGMEQKDLVVDSKVSLTAYVNFMNADDEAEKERFLSEHISSVKRHIEELTTKEYSRKIDKGKRFADYVIMFMPIDSAFQAVLAKEPTLFDETYRKGVIIATEQTIMPFLKVIDITWRKYQQDTNIEEILQAAGNMIERVGRFYDSYKELGKRLGAVCRTYNEGVTKLEDNGQSITTSARQVMKIGAKRAKGKAFTIPEDQVFLNENEETEDEQ